MAKARPIVESWRDAKQLSLLKYYFYRSHDHRKRQQGCNLVAMWQLIGKVPHAIVATAELTTALLVQHKAGHSVATRTNNLCTAWVRFVNGMTDLEQRFREKQSMYKIARQLKMPTSFIELRHRITHEAKPHLHELERAAEHGLSWLFQWYWAHLNDDGPESVDVPEKTTSPTSLDNDISVVLSKYYAAGIKATESRGNHALEDSDLDQAIATLRVLHARQEDWSKTLHVLLEHHIEAHSHHSAHDKRGEASKDNIDISLSSLVFKVFKPLLLKLALQQPRILLSLQDLLLERIAVSRVDDDRENDRDKIHYSAHWLRHLYLDSNFEKYRRMGLLDPELASNMCAEYPNHSTRALLDALGRDAASVVSRDPHAEAGSCTMNEDSSRASGGLEARKGIMKRRLQVDSKESYKRRKD